MPKQASHVTIPMRSSDENPIDNTIPPGMSEEGLQDALTRSGYPLQGLVSERLLPDWRVLEEWGYIDPSSEQHRSLDIFAYLDRAKTEGSSRIGAVLLIECKRSIHPYVFFRSIPENFPYRFPSIAGVRGMLRVENQAGNRSQDVPACEILGLQDHGFVRSGPPRCATFTRATASGKKVTISGTEPFHSVVLPLARARDHYLSLRKPPRDPNRLFPDVVLTIAVFDAPMMLVDDPARPRDPVFVPWVRIVRREADPSASKHRGGWYRFYTVDVVHIAFFPKYLKEHVEPFIEEFQSRAERSLENLKKGGKVPSIDSWEWHQVRAK